MIQGQVQRPNKAQINWPLRILMYLGKKTI